MLVGVTGGFVLGGEIREGISDRREVLRGFVLGEGNLEGRGRICVRRGDLGKEKI